MNLPIQTTGTCVFCGGSATLVQQGSVISGRRDLVGKNQNGASFYVCTPVSRHSILCCQPCRQQRLGKIEAERPHERLIGLVLLIAGIILLGGLYFLVFYLTRNVSADDVTWLEAIAMLVLPCIPGLIFILRASSHLSRGFRNPETLLTDDVVAQGKTAVDKQIKQDFPDASIFVCSDKELKKRLKDNDRAISYRQRGYLH
ncbi:MAG: hypothetical protein FWF36_01450 [Propionibacteriaceae bacterium]|nr:hypothetical protein [Propionibacteriaceae bacterium]